MRFAQGTNMQMSKRANVQMGKRAKENTMANQPEQIRAKASTMADCAKADTIGESGTENLQKRIRKEESAKREECWRQQMEKDQM